MKSAWTTCECANPQCHECHGSHNEEGPVWQGAVTTLYRVDTEDWMGTAFCTSCATDAMTKGVWRRTKPAAVQA